jgi:hypothetical protein
VEPMDEYDYAEKVFADEPQERSEADALATSLTKQHAVARDEAKRLERRLADLRRVIVASQAALEQLSGEQHDDPRNAA